MSTGTPRIMGILNITPDSFSDGGLYYSGGAAEHALRMVEEGADMIDIGGESTRPGSDPVPPQEQIRRIVPVIKELSPVIDIPISVDTMNAEVAAAALDAGADIINDVNGLRSEGMLELASSTGAPVIIMHMNGQPKTMQVSPMQGEVTGAIAAFLKERCDIASEYGIRDSTLDPGIGFGKTVEQNMEIIRNVSAFSFGHPVLVGASRKRFLSEVFPGTDRDEATVRISMEAIRNGADIVRVHNVGMMKEALQHPDDHAGGQYGDQ
jgi:dihydropteroate synthase